MPRRKVPEGIIEGNVIEQVDVSLASLGTKTGILESVQVAVTRGGKLISTNILGGIAGMVEGEGPFLYGLMNADYNLAELEEYLELSGPLTPNDKISQERASRGRFIKRLGVMGPGIAQVSASLINHGMGGLAFAETGESTGGWEWWFYNLGPAASAGSQIVHLFADHYVHWNKSG